MPDLAPADALHHAGLELERTRAACQKPGAAGGLAVMHCVRVCASNRIPQPDWLAAEFLRRYARVDRLEVGSWDEAFGRPGPRGTKRLASARQRKQLKAFVHAAVFRLAHKESDAPINTALFKRIGELPEVDKCATVVNDLYYEALADGLPNVAKLRLPG